MKDVSAVGASISPASPKAGMTVGGSEATVPDPDAPYETGHFLFDIPPNEEEILAEIVAIVEDTLGPQPRHSYPQGHRFTVEGERATHLTLVLSGKVALERESEAGDVVMHHASTGYMIGLLSLINHGAAFFTSVATSEVLGIAVSFEAMRSVAARNKRMAELLAVMLIHTFNKRLLRSEDIQIEKIELSKQLAVERANLAQALRELEGARTELMAQARYASLGELSAGVAHELNNPMAAIQRSADFLKQDMHDLLETCPDRRWAAQAAVALDEALEARVRSTKEVRSVKRRFADITGSAELAQRLIVAGIFNEELAAGLVGADSSRFETIEQAAAIGTNLRNVSTAASRIVELVASLRSYARPDGDPVADVDIHQGIEDTLRLLSHKLHGIEIVRHYGDVPLVSCRPGQLAQVWTNVLTNAAEAMQDAAPEGVHDFGVITIRTSAPDAQSVVVEVMDTGPGIPPNLLEKIFQPRFSTKGGQVRFGMGVGLSVCRSIMTQHNGTIDLFNSDHGTTARIAMPALGPLASPEWAQASDLAYETPPSDVRN